MFRSILLLVALAAAAHAQSAAADPARIGHDISLLAQDKWEGRATCSAGIDSAARYIADRFASLKLTPAGTNGTYLHTYTARPQVHAPVSACAAANVAGILRGTDPALANEYVVVGAHYDHLGRGASFGALDPNSADSIRNGADDNASGTAGVMELARLFSAKPAKRSIIFVTFSGEEWGLLGSDKFAADGMPQGRVQAMVNFDMIGRLRDDKLLVYGVGTAAEMRGVVDAQNTGTPFKLSTLPDGVGPSDHTSFYLRGIPVLHFFTDVHEDYHKASDEASKINAPGEARVLDYAARIIRALADGAPLTYIKQAEKPVAAASDGPRPYFGSVPDMAAGEIPGVRVSGVTGGSPADKAGLKAGDVIVEFDGKTVTDLQSYSDALNARKPGDTVEFVVMRSGQRVKLTAHLTARGG